MKRVVLMQFVLALVLCVGCNTLVPPETSGVSGSVTTTTTLSTAAQSTVSVLTTTTTQTVTTVPTMTVVTTTVPPTTVSTSMTSATLTTTSTSSKYTRPTYPPSDYFSTTEYGALYNQKFSAVSSAVVYKNGVSHELAVDDPRLIRLMNVLAYSFENGYGQRVLSMATVAEVAQAIQDAPCAVEVEFEEVDEVTGTCKFLIVGDWVYDYLHPDHNGMLDMGFVANQYLFDTDLLTYAGF